MSTTNKKSNPQKVVLDEQFPYTDMEKGDTVWHAVEQKAYRYNGKSWQEVTDPVEAKLICIQEEMHEAIEFHHMGLQKQLKEVHQAMGDLKNIVQMSNLDKFGVMQDLAAPTAKAIFNNATINTNHIS